MDIYKNSLEYHQKLRGKIELKVKSPISNREALSLAYTPGVAEPCRQIARDKNAVWKYTNRGNWVAVVTDGSAVLGLGNIGPEAALPVMEGKAALFKEFANVDAFPICLNTQNTEEIIQVVKALAPSFGGINLEDISAPRCFEIEKRLQAECDIPIFHDDQHGTAIVVLAGLMNALQVTQRVVATTRVVVNGVGAAGTAIIDLLYEFGFRHIIAVDSKGIIHKKRINLHAEKQRLATITNFENVIGSLADAVKGADVFIGVSAPNVLTSEMVRSMNARAIIFAMANPVPEIMPNVALEAGAEIVASGRSDFPNQINNVLAFPGIFRGALDNGVKQITVNMQVAAAKALAACVQEPRADFIIPNPFDRSVVSTIAMVIQDQE